jgi:hypothetical protein
MISNRWPALLACLALACTDVTTELIDARAPAISGRDAAAPRADSGTSGGHCAGRLCACEDGVDQDGDELVDGLDPECTSPFDDDESSFGTGGAAGALAECQDCYWDHNTTLDDDGCANSVECLFSGVPGATAPAECATCEISTECQDHCQKSTPNGCDCFGCCAVTTQHSGTIYVLARPGCSLNDAENEDRCQRCQPSPDCNNACGRCELCPGRKRRDLPMDCRGQGMPTGEDPMNVCEGGQTVCSGAQDCPTDYYCQLGCCLFVLQ